MIKRAVATLLFALIFFSRQATCDPNNNGDQINLSNGNKTTELKHIFAPLHLYFMSPSGSDSNDGLAPTARGGHGPWASPNHSVVCGDVILAQAGSYSPLRSWKTPSGCPSKSGGVDGAGGIYFATLLCAGTHVGACSIVGKGTVNLGGIDINANNWAIEGWAVSQGYSSGGPTGFAFVHDTSRDTGVRHHVAYINNVAFDNGSAFTTQNQGANSGAGYGVDYWAIVGNIAQNSAGRNDGYWDAAIDIIGVKNYDTNPGTHIFVAGNFGINNQQTTGGQSDGECIMTDTWDSLNYGAQAVIRDNICFLTERFGLQHFFQNLSADTPTIKDYNNTFFASNQQNYSRNGAYGDRGDINIQSTISTMPWTIQVYNNIAKENLGRSNAASYPSYNYAFATGGYPTRQPIGNTGVNPPNSQNVFSSPVGSCPPFVCHSACDTGNNAITCDATLSTLGLNIYEDPGFKNTSDLLANQTGIPNCSKFTNTAACMGWNYQTQTATNPSVIYDLTPTASGTSGKGYRPPTVCVISDPDYPTWLKGIVFLSASGYMADATIVENNGLITTPCEY